MIEAGSLRQASATRSRLVSTNQRETHDISLKYYTLEDLRAILETRPILRLSPEVEAKINQGARYIQKIAQEDRHIYGVNTGFGSLCETRIAPDEMSELQHKHLMSHSCGVGEIAPERISRLTMIIKLLTFRSGHSGISLDVVNRLLDFWNNDIIPATPKKGTVGASGDLAPLAHMALPVIGMGQVHFQGQVVDTAVALDELAWTPIKLKPKEGLALTNGVQYINAIAADCLMQSGELIRCADVITALSMQGFSTANTFYQQILHETSLHPERQTVAANLRMLLEGSNHYTLPHCNKAMEDAYSYRCAPQVHAAIRQTFSFAKDIVEKECNSVSDNPLFFPEQDQVLCGGNLHGESTAFALDFLAIALSELANISERRTYQLLSGQHGLPSFLVKHPGLDSGLMIVQYTAAALVNENKVFATPASIDTIPTCQLQEDHVSMGGTSAYKLCQIIENCEYVLSIELLTAMQAIDLNEGLQLSPITAEIAREFRKSVSFLAEDRNQSIDIGKSRDFLREHKRAWYMEIGLG
jgi:histidine ammonia-lyase